MTKSGLLLAFFFLPIILSAQITINVDPNTNASIKGNLELNRTKYFNVADMGIGIENRIHDSTLIARYFDDYNMSLGRSIGMVKSNSSSNHYSWKGKVIEDKNKPGYVDINDLKSKFKVDNSESPEFRKRWTNMDVSYHDSRNAYPEFMHNYKASEDSHEKYPGDIDAASDLAVSILKYGFNDWNRPGTYEIVNEPDFLVLNNQKFADLHSAICQKSKKAGIKTEIGGPCLSILVCQLDISIKTIMID